MTRHCYIGNLDGTHQGLVIARNQKIAAAIAKTTLYDFRRHWSRFVLLKSRDFKSNRLYVLPYDVAGAKWMIRK